MNIFRGRGKKKMGLMVKIIAPGGGNHLRVGIFDGAVTRCWLKGNNLTLFKQIYEISVFLSSFRISGGQIFADAPDEIRRGYLICFLISIRFQIKVFRGVTIRREFAVMSFLIAVVCTLSSKVFIIGGHPCRSTSSRFIETEKNSPESEERTYVFVSVI